MNLPIIDFDRAKHCNRKVTFDRIEKQFYLDGVITSCVDIVPLTDCCNVAWSAAANQVILSMLTPDLCFQCSGCGCFYDGELCWVCAEDLSILSQFHCAINEDMKMRDAAKTPLEREREFYELSPSDPLPTDRLPSDAANSYEVWKESEL